MKKQVIHFDNTGYTEATKALDEAIETINKHSQELTTNGYLLTIEDIKLIADRDNKFNKKVYSSQLKDICNTFGVDYNKVCTFEYTITNSMFSEMANGKCKYLYSLNNDLYKCFTLHTYLADSKYIDIINNVASKTIQANELIKDEYTSYTNNDKQNKVLDLTKQLQDLYKQFNKLGINNYNVDYLINKSSGDIDPNTFYRYTE